MGIHRNITTGGMSRILAGAFGIGRPMGVTDTDPRSIAPGIYAYHEGDLFTPGAENFIFNSMQELPIQSRWGGGSDANQGTEYPMNAWPVFSGAPQVWSNPTVTLQGLGGLQTGAFVQQPLLDEESEQLQ